MGSRVMEPSKEHLRQRRGELLKRARTDYADLRDRALHDELVGAEWHIWDELEAIDYLLGAELPSRNGDGNGA